MNDEEHERNTEVIRNLNDCFRKTFQGGRVVMTSGVQGLGEEGISALVRMVQNAPASDPANDPYQENDFGAIEYRQSKYFWKIDYYDRNLQYHSEDPANQKQTVRVLTIMRADEY